MAVINILKDGTIVKDLTGHIVSMKDCPMAYEVINGINNQTKNSRIKSRKPHKHFDASKEV